MINAQEIAGELLYLLANGDTKKYIDKCYDLYLNFSYEYQEIQDILSEIVMSSVSALRSLLNGEGQVFYEEAMERHALYTDEEITDVVISPYSERPHLFSFEDLKEDPGNWLNLAVTRYYHKESVRLAQEED